MTMRLKRGSRVVTRDTNEEGVVDYLWTDGIHVDVLLEGATFVELIRIEDLELL